MKIYQKTIHLFIFIYLAFFSFKTLKAQTNSQNSESYALHQTLSSAHQSEITSIRFNQNSSYFASGDRAGKIIIWKKDNSQNFSPYRTFTNHTGTISGINFSDDNKLLITASYDGKVNVYSITQNKLHYSFTNPAVPPYENVNGNEVSFAVFDVRDNNKIYFGGFNRKVFVGKLGSTDLQEIFNSDLYAVTSGEIKQNQLAIGFDGNIKIFNTQNLEQTTLLGTLNAAYENKVCEVAFLNNSNKIACWLVNGKIQIWDLNSNQITKQIQVGSQHGSSMFAFSKDDKNMLSGQYGNEARWWNVTENSNEVSIKQSLSNHQSTVKCVSVSNNNDFLATADGNNIKIWKLGNDNSNQTVTETITQTSTNTNTNIGTSTFTEIPENPNNSSSNSNFSLNENIDMRLQFERSESVLIEDSYEKLDEVIAFLERKPNVVIELHGHTDNVGNGHLNLKLSGERILATKNYMISKRIEASRITMQAHGQSQPLNDNSTEEKREKNRRVEMILRERN
jgi:outer membrane protein OmpA-like peptidoglycan-associated protein